MWRDDQYPGVYIQKSYAENQVIMKKTGKPTRPLTLTFEKYCDYYKTTVFDKTNAGRLKEAEETYYEALFGCSNEGYKAEMADYIVFQYYKIRNKEKFKNWEMEIARWILPSNDLLIKVSKMKAEMTKL